jgi:hypothetical protein
MSATPLAPVVAEVRKVVLGASPRIREGVKWNSPSFYVGEEHWFATADSRARGKSAAALTLVLHRGAATKVPPPKAPDPKGLFQWKGPDRGVVQFESAAQVRRAAPALRAIIKRWIKDL